MATRQEKTRQQLVTAATRLFTTYGVRRTAMEQIAQEAQVAKATAYAYFPNKDAVFVAVVDAVIAQLEAAFASAAEGAGTPAEAVRAGLVAKFGLEWKLVHGSPHAGELMASSEGLAAQAMTQAHARHARSLASWLVKAGVKRSEAPELAETLDDAFEGLARGASSLEQLEARGALLVRRLLGT